MKITIRKREIGSVLGVILCKVIRGGLTNETFKQILDGVDSRGITSVKVLREGDVGLESNDPGEDEVREVAGA